MASIAAEIYPRLLEKSRKAEALISALRSQLGQIHVNLQSSDAKFAAQIREENDQLRKKVEELKAQLIQAEVKNGVPQYYDFGASVLASSNAVTPAEKPSEPAADAKPAAQTQQKSDKKAEKKPKEKKELKAPEPKAEARPVDVSRLDMRVGRIVNVQKHPDADSLYLEEIDVKEDRPRTVVSGLVKHVPIEQMQNRLVITLCNLKPAKLRGILSEAMVMCASSPEKVEILDPPAGSEPGDRIVFDAFPGTPDTQLNPKDKVWEAVQPDLKTDANRVATYKGAPFSIPGKGVCLAATMANSNIK